MDKRVIGAVVGIGLLLLLLLIVLLMFGKSKESPKPLETSSVIQTSSLIITTKPTEITTTQTTSNAPRYILGEWEGKLAVFETDDSTPYKKYDIYIRSFPKEEQERLRKGIPIYDEQTLANLLEDYTS